MNACNARLMTHSIQHKLISARMKLGFIVKIKSEIPDFEKEKTKILTTAIRVVFRRLKFESDEDIGEKDSFCSGTKLRLYDES